MTESKSKLPRLRRTGVVTALVAFAVLVAGVTYALRRPPQNAEAAARELAGCIVSGDGACVLRYMDEDEVARTNANAATVSEFLAVAFPGGIASFNASGDPTFEKLGDTGGVLLTQQINATGSTTTRLVLHVFGSDDAFKAKDLIWSLLYSAIAARIMSGGRTEYAKGPEKDILYSETFDQQLRLPLQSSKLRGVYGMLPDGPMSLGWEELSTFLAGRAEKARKRLADTAGR